MVLRSKDNWEKSAICGINIMYSKVSTVAFMLNCKLENFPFMYLGLPSGGYPKSGHFWQPVLDRVQKKVK